MNCERSRAAADWKAKKGWADRESVSSSSSWQSDHELTESWKGNKEWAKNETQMEDRVVLSPWAESQSGKNELSSV